MDLAMQIVNAIIKIQENIFPDEWEDMFEDVNLSEVHCIDLIGTLEYPNVTKMANEMDMTRGLSVKSAKGC